MLFNECELGFPRTQVREWIESDWEQIGEENILS
jgi:hypothetical protein